MLILRWQEKRICFAFLIFLLSVNVMFINLADISGNQIIYHRTGLIGLPKKLFPYLLISVSSEMAYRCKKLASLSSISNPWGQGEIVLKFWVLNPQLPFRVPAQTQSRVENFTDISHEKNLYWNWYSLKTIFRHTLCPRNVTFRI